MKRRNARCFMSAVGALFSTLVPVSTAAAVFVFSEVFSCKLDYGGNVEAKELRDSIPDMAVTNADYRVVRNGKAILRMHADSAQIFNTAGNRVLKGVSFEQYDNDGKEVAHGSSAKATQSVQTEDVNFEGGLEVYLSTEEATIRAETLYWNSSDKTLKAPADQRVTVTKKDGSKIEGTGFFADLNSRQVELSGGVEGNMSAEDND